MKDITFSVSPYRGYEEEVLRIRNDNRPDPQTRNYLDWRYGGATCPYAPVIFWAHNACGTRVGMASINFRPYWVDNELHYFCVLGDISVDKDMRGKGIGKRLLQYATTYIKLQSYSCSFVIPNEAVRKILDALKWVAPEPFAWYVWHINPSSRIYNRMKMRMISKVLGAAFTGVMKIKLSRYEIDKYRIEVVDTFDESFEMFWTSFPKQGIVLRDRCRASLQWRYENHPGKKYRAAKIVYEDRFVGYIVYESADNRTYCIIDMLMIEKVFIKSAMKMFLQYIARQKGAEAVRIKLNASHPYSSDLKQMGFIRKLEGDVYQAYIPDGAKFLSTSKWFLSRGDKDT